MEYRLFRVRRTRVNVVPDQFGRVLQAGYDDLTGVKLWLHKNAKDAARDFTSTTGPRTNIRDRKTIAMNAANGWSPSQTDSVPVAFEPGRVEDWRRCSVSSMGSLWSAAREGNNSDPTEFDLQPQLRDLRERFQSFQSSIVCLAISLTADRNHLAGSIFFNLKLTFTYLHPHTGGYSRLLPLG
jgi:hypothetical protein